MRALIVLLMVCGAVSARDDEKAAPKESATPPEKVDWGAFSDHIAVSGVVEKVSEAGFTLKILKGYTRARPPKPQYEDVDLQYHESAQIRWPKLPPKLDEARKKVPYTDKDLAALKRPQGAPGYAAQKSDLKEGATVKVQLLKPKGVAAAKLVTSDYKVKYVTIVSEGAGAAKK